MAQPSVEKLEELQTTLQGLLKDLPGGDQDRLLQGLSEAPALESAIALAQKGLFLDIYGAAGRDVALTKHLCLQHPQDVQEIARRLYKVPNGITSVDTLRAYQSRLFQQQPTAVLLGLIDRDIISLPPAVKTPVVSVVEGALKDGFNIAQHSTRVLLQHTKALEKVDGKIRKSAEDAIKTIQRLQALVRWPQDIGPLMVAGFDSAHSIAVSELKDFVSTMKDCDMPEEVAKRVHDHASTVDIRNEQTWAIALNEKNNKFLPRILVKDVRVREDLDSMEQQLGSKQLINLSTIFQDMDSVECTECSSVLGPSAYFVDLLRLLHETKTVKGVEGAQAPTLLSKLLDRRPDLQNLQLSCANTKSLVPYLDLVTEILESFIEFVSNSGKVSGDGSIKSFDAPNVNPDGTCASQPRNSNPDVYNRIVSEEVFPMDTFPYNLSIDTIRELLSATGTSRYEILAKLASEERVLTEVKPLGSIKWDDAERKRLKPAARAMINRSMAAECLGLNQEGFMAICREAFQPLDFWRGRVGGASLALGQTDYESMIGVKTTAMLWGYEPVKKSEPVPNKNAPAEAPAPKQLQDTPSAEISEQNMLDEVRGEGLTFIKQQLLPRAGITIQELQEILKTQYIGRRLIITTDRNNSDSKKARFTGKLSDMRLRASLLGNEQSSSLTREICHDLQAFIRLWKKLGWSIAHLDSVLGTLKRCHDDLAEGISPDMLQDLAATKRLSALCKTPLGTLQVLWGDIDTNGPESLYSRTFLLPQILRLDSSFKADHKGRFLSSGDNISQHKIVLLSALDIPESEFPATLASALIIGSDDMEEPLTNESILNLSSLSSIFRVSLICKIIGISPAFLGGFRAFFQDEDIFKSPRHTLSIVEKWQTLTSLGWTIEDIIQAIREETNPSIEVLALGACSELASTKLAIEARYPQKLIKSVEGDVELKKTIPLLFDNLTALSITRLLEGTFTASVDCPIQAQESKPTTDAKATQELSFSASEALAVKIPDSLAQILSFVTVGEESIVRITITGLLSEQQRTDAKNILFSKPGWNQTFSLLDQKSQSAFQTLCRQLQLSGEESEKAKKLFLSTAASAVKDRKDFVLQKALPIISAQLLRQTIVDSVSTSFPIDAAPLMALLGEIVHYNDTSGAKVSALEALKSIKLHDANDQQFDGYFCPPASGKYSFVVYSESEQPPNLTLDGERLVFYRNAGIWQSKENETRLINGTFYQFSYDGNLEKEARYLTQDSITPQLLKPDMFVSKESQSVARVVYRKLSIAAKIVQLYYLSLSELEYFNRAKFIDFENITLKDLQRLNAYKQLRDDTVKRESDYTLVQLMSWAGKSGSSSKDLMSKIAAATGWPSKQVENILNAKYPGKDVDFKKNLFNNEMELSSMNETVKIMNKMNLPSLAAIDLFRIGTPYDIKSLVEKDRVPEHAAALQLSIQSSKLGSSTSSAVEEADNRLRERRRNVLIQFLLNHEKIRSELKLRDADNLFEHFLIDVKMGAKLQTSRMRQAISTVQLFVQRCNLGLESVEIPEDPNAKPPKPKKIVQCASVSQIRWKYMSKFTHWAANRKLFLYPENWIDPTLRDNKSEPFKALESTLSQSSLTMDKITETVKAYISAMNDVSDLEVLSYVWQPLDAPKARFHFIGRTRQAPFQYYYRSADLSAGKLTDIRWAAWSLIDIDIPIFESDINGDPLPRPGSYVIPAVFRGRIYLFIPQFIAQTVPREPDGRSFEEVAKKGGPRQSASKKVWEIKMAWTELRNGKWSPKQTSQASLRVPHPDAPVAPPLSSFRFILTSSGASIVPETLTIEVESWYSMRGEEVIIPPDRVTANEGEADYIKAKQWPHGYFKIRGNQIVAVPVIPMPTPDPKKPAEKTVANYWATANPTTQDIEQKLMVINDADYSVPTTFQKLWARATKKEEKKQTELGSTTTSIIYVEPSLKAKIQKVEEKYFLLAKTGIGSNIDQDYTWTVSFDQVRSQTPNRFSALLLQVSNSSHSKTFFAIPPAENTASVTETVQLFNHPASTDLMEQSLIHDGVDGLYQFLNQISDAAIQDNIFGKQDKGYHEEANPYSLYTWELGMHVVSLLMERLAATQQFDLALDVAKLVFDPNADGEELSRCWKFLPFRKISSVESIADILNSLEPHTEGVSSAQGKKIEDWKDKPFSPHVVARDRPVVYMKRFVMKYIEVLISSGDEYFRQNSLESIPLAIQRYVEASHLFGPAGQQVPKMGSLPVKTFKELSAYIDVFSNAKVDMELDFPYSSEPCYRGALPVDDHVAPEIIGKYPYAGWVQTGYFCLPANTKMTELRNLIDDRLFKIRSSMDINGRTISLSLFDPPIDPGVLAQAVAANLSPSVLLNDQDSPLPNYRFYYLLQKAMEICTELKVLGDAFLSAKEKKDSETLTMLLARNEVLGNTTQLALKDLQKTEALKSLAALEEARKGSTMKLAFYLALIGEPLSKVPGEETQWTDIPQSIEEPTKDGLRMNSYEKQEMDKSDSAAALSEKASILELVAAGLMAIPNFFTNMQPMGVGTAIKMDAENIAKFMQGTAMVMNLKAQMDTHDAQRAQRTNNLIRQLQERRLQANSTGWEIKKIDKDIAAQRIRIALSESDILAQQQQIERSKEIQEWHRLKYTNSTLYVWLENSFRTIYHETFLLAMQLARKAERSFQFEMAAQAGVQNLSYLMPGGYWDSARDGLLSANNLFLGLKRLETVYMEKRAYDYEMTKNISLRQIDPTALFSLRQTGTAAFSLREVLFDLDFPGHYFRRVKSISISIPAVVGPYTGINCILSLVEHRTRVSPAADSYLDKGRDDPRFRSEVIPISSIAVTSGQSDTGTFELNFAGERYLPFEGAGVISKWKLQFPTAYRQFDYHTISDVILHVRYTASEGGIPLQQAANAAVDDYMGMVKSTSLDGALSALIDLKNDYSNAWYDLIDSSSLNMIKMTQLAGRLPFFTKAFQVKVKGLLIFIKHKPNKSDVTVSLAKPSGLQLELASELKMGNDVTVSVCNKVDKSIEEDFEIEVKGEKTSLENILVVIKYSTQRPGDNTTATLK